jgi:hypothetical protein
VSEWPDRLKSLRGEVRGGVERISCDAVFHFLGVPVTPRSRSPVVARHLQTLLHALGWRNESRCRIRSSHFYRREQEDVLSVSKSTQGVTKEQKRG